MPRVLTEVITEGGIMDDLKKISSLVLPLCIKLYLLLLPLYRYFFYKFIIGTEIHKTFLLSQEKKENMR